MGYKRKQEDLHRLNKSYEETKTSCFCGVYFDTRKNRFIRFHKSNCLRMDILKRKSNKTFRQKSKKLEVSIKGNLYKKLGHDIPYEY